MLIVLFIAAILLTQHFITAQGIYNFTSSTLSVNPGSFSGYRLVYSNSSQPMAVLELNPAVNVYLLTEQGYSLWTSAAGSAGFNGLAYAESLNGTILAFRNASVVSIPVISNMSDVPVYTANATMIKNGTYYAVIDNTNDSANHAKTIGVQIVYGNMNGNGSQGQLESSFSHFINESIIAGIVMLALIIAAIVTIAYGLIAKEKPRDGIQEAAAAQQPSAAKGKADASSNEIDALYAGIEDKPQKSGKPASKGRKQKSSNNTDSGK